VAKLAIAELRTDGMNIETATGNRVTPDITRNEVCASILKKIHALSDVECEKVSRIKHMKEGAGDGLCRMPCSASQSEKFTPKNFVQFEYNRGACSDGGPDIEAKKDGWFGPICSVSDLDDANLELYSGPEVF
jgi:hypothetical protein